MVEILLKVINSQRAERILIPLILGMPRLFELNCWVGTMRSSNAIVSDLMCHGWMLQEVRLLHSKHFRFVFFFCPRSMLEDSNQDQKSYCKADGYSGSTGRSTCALKKRQLNGTACQVEKKQAENHCHLIFLREY